MSDILDDIVEGTPGAIKRDAQGNVISKNTEGQTEEEKKAAAEAAAKKAEDDDLTEEEKKVATEAAAKKAEDDDEDEDDGDGDGDDEDDDDDGDDEDDDLTEEEKKAAAEAAAKKADDDPEKIIATNELAAINTFLESDYENLEAAKTAYSAEIKVDKDKIGALTDQVTEMQGQIDPLKYFGGDKDAFVLQQLKNLKPELDPTALTTIMSANLKEMSPVDIMALKAKLENPGALDGAGQATAKDFVYNELGIDPDEIEDLTPLQKSKMDIEANKARKEFAKLAEEVEVPTVDGLTAKRQEQIDSSTTEWTPIVKDELIKSMDSITFSAKGQDGKLEEVFKFAISDQYKQAMLDAADKTISDLAARGVEVNDQTKHAIVKAWKDEFVRQNFTKIMQAHTNDRVANMTEAEFTKRHNPSDDGKKRKVRRKAAPVSNDAKMKAAAEKKIMDGEI